MVKDFKFYTHSEKEDNRYKFEQLGGDPESKAANDFAYCGYEVEFSCRVDMDSGKVEAYAVNGVNLEGPICLT